jgi:hypothetical protein
MAKPPKYIWTSGGVGIRDKKSPSGYREVSPQEFIEDIMCCGFCDCRTGNKVNTCDIVNPPNPVQSPTIVLATGNNATVTTEVPPQGYEIISLVFYANGVLQTETTDFVVTDNPDGSKTITPNTNWGDPADPCILALYYAVSC